MKHLRAPLLLVVLFLGLFNCNLASAGSASGLPQEFPKEFPIYSQMHLKSVIKSNSSPSYLVTFKFDSNTKKEDVLAFYKEKLQQNFGKSGSDCGQLTGFDSCNIEAKKRAIMSKTLFLKIDLQRNRGSKEYDLGCLFQYPTSGGELEVECTLAQHP